MATASDAPDGAPAAPEFAETGAGAPDAGYLAAIVADRSSYRAVADCDWFGQVAFPAGAPVSSTHPGLPVWIRDGLVAAVEATVG